MTPAFLLVPPDPYQHPNSLLASSLLSGVGPGGNGGRKYFENTKLSRNVQLSVNMT